MMSSRSLRSSFIVVLLGWLTAAGAAVNLLALLPGSGGVTGWALVAGAEKQASTDKGLYSMYDGAVPVMKQAGIVAGGQRIYKSGSKRLTVDIFRFSTSAAAMKYYQKRKAEIAGSKGFGPIAGIQQAGVAAVTGRTTVAYTWNKQYCTSLSVNCCTAADKQALAAFARYTARKITALK